MSFLIGCFDHCIFSQEDLDLSVERGVWATQPHNELILNQAFRTSQDVFLIFGANKSGEFFGYARMAGPIVHSEERLSWASRDSVQHSPSASISSLRRGSKVSETIPEEHSPLLSPTEQDWPSEPPRSILSPSEHRSVAESPLPVTSPEEKQLRHDVRVSDYAMQARPSSQVHPAATRHHEVQAASAPPEMHRAHRKITFPSNLTPVGERTLDPNALRTEDKRSKSVFTLGPGEPRSTVTSLRDVLIDETAREVERMEVTQNPEDVQVAQASTAERRPETWGTPFKVQWIRTERLPFYRTRHLRNPWNHDREVKVSRDGTELEPHVGQALLDEWDKPEPTSPLPMSPVGVARRGPGPKQSTRFNDPTQAGSSQVQPNVSVQSIASAASPHLDRPTPSVRIQDFPGRETDTKRQ